MRFNQLNKDKQHTLRYKLHKIGKQWLTLLGLNGSKQVVQSDNGDNHSFQMQIPEAIALRQIDQLNQDTRSSIEVLRGFPFDDDQIKLDLTQFEQDQLQFQTVYQALQSLEFQGQLVQKNDHDEATLQAYQSLKNQFETGLKTYLASMKVDTNDLTAGCNQLLTQLTTHYRIWLQNWQKAIHQDNRTTDVDSLVNSFAVAMKVRVNDVRQSINASFATSYANKVDVLTDQNKSRARRWAEDQVDEVQSSLSQQYQNQFSAAVANLKPQYELSMASLRVQYEESLQAVKFSNAQQVSNTAQTTQKATQWSVEQSLKSQFAAEKADLQMSHATIVDNLQAEFATSMQQQITALDTQYQHDVSAADQMAKAQIMQQTKLLDRAYQQASHKVENQNQQSQAVLKQRHARKLAQVKKSTDQAMKSQAAVLKANQKAKIDSITAQNHLALKKQRETLKMQFADQVAQQSKSFAATQSSAVSEALASQAQSLSRSQQMQMTQLAHSFNAQALRQTQVAVSQAQSQFDKIMQMRAQNESKQQELQATQLKQQFHVELDDQLQAALQAKMFEIQAVKSQASAQADQAVLSAMQSQRKQAQSQISSAVSMAVSKAAVKASADLKSAQQKWQHSVAKDDQLQHQAQLRSVAVASYETQQAFKTNANQLVKAALHSAHDQFDQQLQQSVQAYARQTAILKQSFAKHEQSLQDSATLAMKQQSHAAYEHQNSMAQSFQSAFDNVHLSAQANGIQQQQADQKQWLKAQYQDQMAFRQNTNQIVKRVLGSYKAKVADSLSQTVQFTSAQLARRSHFAEMRFNSKLHGVESSAQQRIDYVMSSADLRSQQQVNYYESKADHNQFVFQASLHSMQFALHDQKVSTSLHMQRLASQYATQSESMANSFTESAHAQLQLQSKAASQSALQAVQSLRSAAGQRFDSRMAKDQAALSSAQSAFDYELQSQATVYTSMMIKTSNANLKSMYILTSSMDQSASVQAANLASSATLMLRLVNTAHNRQMDSQVAKYHETVGQLYTDHQMELETVKNSYQAQLKSQKQYHQGIVGSLESQQAQLQHSLSDQKVSLTDSFTHSMDQLIERFTTNQQTELLMAKSAVESSADVQMNSLAASYAEKHQQFSEQANTKLMDETATLQVELDKQSMAYASLAIEASSTSDTLHHSITSLQSSASVAYASQGDHFDQLLSQQSSTAIKRLNLVKYSADEGYRSQAAELAETAQRNRSLAATQLKSYQVQHAKDFAAQSKAYDRSLSVASYEATQSAHSLADAVVKSAISKAEIKWEQQAADDQKVVMDSLQSDFKATSGVMQDQINAVKAELKKMTRSRNAQKGKIAQLRHKVAGLKHHQKELQQGYVVKMNQTVDSLVASYAQVSQSLANDQQTSVAELKTSFETKQASTVSQHATEMETMTILMSSVAMSATSLAIANSLSYQHQSASVNDSYVAKLKILGKEFESHMASEKLQMKADYRLKISDRNQTISQLQSKCRALKKQLQAQYGLTD